MKKLIAILCAIFMLVVIELLVGRIEVHKRTTITSWTVGEDKAMEQVLIDGECIEVSYYDVDATEFFAMD